MSKRNGRERSKGSQAEGEAEGDRMNELGEIATNAMRRCWLPETMVRAERTLWLRVMAHQRRLGVNIPGWAIRESEAVHSVVDMDAIRHRELKTKHDLKARLEVYCELAGHEYHHMGMTSSDVTENVVLDRIRRSLLNLVEQGADAGRLLSVAERLPWRGIVGPVGTGQDQIDLLGSPEALDDLNSRLAEEYGFTRVLGSIGQNYHRSIDLWVLSEVASVVGGYKSPLRAVLSGTTAAAAEIAGGQWNEGDVAHSAARRWYLPTAFLAASAILKEGSRGN